MQAWKKSSRGHESSPNDEHGMSQRTSSPDRDSSNGAATTEIALYHGTIAEVVSLL